MKLEQFRVLGIAIPASLLLTGCSENFALDEPSVEVLGSAIRTVGYPCTRVVSSNELDAAATSWRVSCQGTTTYTANLAADGSICVTPIAYSDAIAPAPIVTPEERCVARSEV